MTHRNSKLFIGIVLLASLYLSGIISEYTKSVNIPRTTDNYGEYTSEWLNLTLCRGPKAKNLTDVKAAIVTPGDGSYGLSLNLTVHKALTLYEVKTQVYRIDGTKKKSLWNYKVTDPCRNIFIFAEVARRELGSADCRVKQGFYSMYYNYTLLNTFFMGKTFYYGKYLLHTLAISKQGNVCCFEHVQLIKKKTKA